MLKTDEDAGAGMPPNPKSCIGCFHMTESPKNKICVVFPTSKPEDVYYGGKPCHDQKSRWDFDTWFGKPLNPKSCIECLNRTEIPEYGTCKAFPTTKPYSVLFEGKPCYARKEKEQQE